MHEFYCSTDYKIKVITKEVYVNHMVIINKTNSNDFWDYT